MKKITTAKALAAVVRNHRRKLKMTQQDAAELMGLKQATISSFENNPNSSKLDTLFKLLASLGLELEVSERNLPNNDWKEEW